MKVKLLMYRRNGSDQESMIFDINYTDKEIKKYLKKQNDKRNELREYKDNCYDIEIKLQEVIEKISLYRY